MNDAMVMDVSGEWAIACEVQQRFMNGSSGPAGSLDYSARCRQMIELGGDFYDFAPQAGNRLALIVGDASGKGLAAALMMANVQSSLNTAILFAGHDGPELFRAVNRQVYASSLENRFATLFYALFDEATRTLRYVNAGHNPPMVIRRDGSVLQLEAAGAPIGVFSDSTYEECAVELHPGDLVVAYTDGVTEAANAGGAEWGVEGLRRTAAECGAASAEGIVEAIFAALDGFSEGRQSDDATVAVLRVNGNLTQDDQTHSNC